MPYNTFSNIYSFKLFIFPNSSIKPLHLKTRFFGKKTFYLFQNTNRKQNTKYKNANIFFKYFVLDKFQKIESNDACKDLLPGAWRSRGYSPLPVRLFSRWHFTSVTRTRWRILHNLLQGYIPYIYIFIHFFKIEGQTSILGGKCQVQICQNLNKTSLMWK